MQHSEPCSEFSGVAGRVLIGSVSAGSFISGLVLGILLVGINALLFLAGAANAATLFNHMLIAMALARFALNGWHGEWSGSLFSSTGGDWGDAGKVALRYVVLSALWFVPLTLVSMTLIDPAALQSQMMMGGAPRGLLLFAAVYTAASVLTPPVLLIVAVSAENFGELFLPDLWRRQFSGRQGDLFAVYVVYAGALGAVLMVAVPVVLIAFAMHVVIGLGVGAIGLGLLFGMSLNLLGRLCGFFAAGEQGLTAPLEPELTLSNPPDGPLEPSPTEPQPVADAAPPAVADATVPVSVPVSAGVPVAVASPAPPRPSPGPVVAAGEPESVPDVDPQALQSAALEAFRSGQVESGLEQAREAFPHCFQRGDSMLAAELFCAMKAHVGSLGLSAEQLLTLGATLAKMEDYGSAVKAYSVVLGAEPTEVRAIKGLLQVAEKILQEKDRPEAAAKVFRFLLNTSPQSPLNEFMRAGLEQAERRMVQSV